MGIIGSKREVIQAVKSHEAGDSSFVFPEDCVETIPLINKNANESVVSEADNAVTETEKVLAITDAEKNLQIYRKEQGNEHEQIAKKKKEVKKHKHRPQYKTSDRHDAKVPALLQGRNPLDKPKMRPIRTQEGDTIANHVPVHLLSSVVSEESKERKHGTSANMDSKQDPTGGVTDVTLPYTLSIGCPRRPPPPRLAKLPPLDIDMTKVREMDFRDVKSQLQTKNDFSSDKKTDQTTTECAPKADADAEKQITEGEQNATRLEKQSVTETAPAKNLGNPTHDRDTPSLFGSVGGEKIGDAALLKLKLFDIELN